MTLQLSLISSSETETIENKLVSGGNLPGDLWEPITAFCNSDGGTIKLGVDKNGIIKGVETKYIDKLCGDINSQCLSSYNHKIYPNITLNPNGTIEVYIPPTPASLRPIFSSSRGLPKGGRVRIGTSNIQLDEEWIKRYAIAARGGAEAQVYPGNYNQYFDSSAIARYLESVKTRRGNVYVGLTTEDVLIKLRAIDTNNKITLFGLLAFGTQTSLSEIVAPTIEVAVTQYSGVDKVNPDDIAEVSLDDKALSGNVVEQFENALSLLLSKMPVRSRIDPEGKRRDYLAIPELAIREVLANAIAHRDYSTLSGRIQIDIYSNRIEFTNPGRSLIPLEMIETAHPEARNPLLMSYLRDLRITESRGRGIRTIKASLKDARLAEPTFEHRHDWFVATIYTSAFIKDEDRVWLSKFKGYKLNDRQLNALVHIRHKKTGINNSEYREINNMANVKDDIKAKKELAKLAGLSLVKKQGKKRFTRYILNKTSSTQD